MKVKEIMRKQFAIIENTKRFVDVLEILIKNRTNSAVIVNKNGECIGIIDTYKMLKAVLPAYLVDDEVTAAMFKDEEVFKKSCIDAKDLPIDEFLVNDVEPLSEDDVITVAAVRILMKRQKRLPVCDANKKPIGLVTRTELKRIVGSFFGIEQFP